MPPHENQIVSLLAEPSFSFDSKGARHHISHAGSHGRETLVDPTPAYAHDLLLVQEELAHLQQVAPLPFPLGIFVLAHESEGRTNGFYSDEYSYKDGEQIEIGGVKRYPPAGVIVLSGKRIPIHPAMTRYVVAHEYGHGVMYHLARLRGVDDTKLLASYREQCRPDASAAYGCGKWHANIGELFANDFRILIAQRECEYWPHPGFNKPEENLAVVGFWTNARKELV